MEARQAAREEFEAWREEAPDADWRELSDTAGALLAIHERELQQSLTTRHLYLVSTSLLSEQVAATKALSWALSSLGRIVNHGPDAEVGVPSLPELSHEVREALQDSGRNLRELRRPPVRPKRSEASSSPALAGDFFGVAEAKPASAEVIASRNGFSLDLLMPDDAQCILFVSVMNMSRGAKGLGGWGAALQLDGFEYQMWCPAVHDSEVAVTTPEGPKVLDARERVWEYVGLRPGEAISGWLLVWYGKHVTREMVEDPAARFHFTGGTFERAWSGPSGGPAEARRFSGPSVKPEETFDRIDFEPREGQTLRPRY